MDPHTLHRPPLGASRTQPRFGRRSLKSQLGRLALLALVAAAPGCATQYRFNVDAIHAKEAVEPRRSYQLVDARAGAHASDPHFAEVARDVQTALSSQGLYAAPPGTTPELVIEVDFGMSAPIVTERTRSEPVYVPMPATSSGGLRLGGGPEGAGGQLRYLGSREVPYTVTTYRKYLRLRAREHEGHAASAQPLQIWSVEVTNQDRSDRLFEYTRLMVAAAMDHIGKSHDREQRVVMTRQDRRVTFVRDGSGSS